MRPSRRIPTYNNPEVSSIWFKYRIYCGPFKDHEVDGTWMIYREYTVVHLLIMLRLEPLLAFVASQSPEVQGKRYSPYLWITHGRKMRKSWTQVWQAKVRTL